MDTRLRQRLLEMAAEDERVRASLAGSGVLHEGYVPEMSEVHRRNAADLREIVDRHGWPGRSLVGEDGARAAWIILQHAIGDPDLQKRCLPLLWEAVKRGEAEPAHAAYLEDRIRFFHRLPQGYGTQFDWDESGQMSPWTLARPDRVDEDRRSVGLPPLAEAVRQARAAAAREPRPADLKQRRREMTRWARSVGWITDQSILWRRLDRPGHESARVFAREGSWHLEGTAVFSDDDRPCRLDYRVDCDARWATQMGRVTGWVGDEPILIVIAAGADRRWFVNGEERPDVAGCLDLDLNFSPSTNLLPIRRLGLQVGQEARVRAAWLRFPGFALEPLDQIYRRIGLSRYRYESGGGRFAADLEVDGSGLVTDYPGLCALEAIT
jgi:hypothetical protein